MPPPNLRISFLITAIVLAIACLPGSTALGAEPTAIPVLTKPAARLTTADLQQFTELASNNKISARQAQTFIAGLSPAQQQTLRALGEAKIRADLQAGKKVQP
jgi:hypothetical protein